MKMNVITVTTGPNFNAGGKAPSDIIEILQKNYHSRTTMIGNFNSEEFLNNHHIIYRVLCRLSFTFAYLNSRIKNEVTVLQFPMDESTNFLHKLFIFNMNFLNKRKTIILVHDLDGIRYQKEWLHKHDLERFNKAKYIIVHNDIMKELLLKDGVKSKIYTINLFDYLCKDNNIQIKRTINNKEPVIIYAGNLSKEKSPFIHELEEKKMKFKLNLYGVGIDKPLNKKINYIGKYPADILPNKLSGSLGLVWDGLISNKDAKKSMKNYTRYNNPHKVSCYIAAGLPIIVWEKSAISQFIKEKNIGYTIENIYDINNLDFSDYQEKLANILKLQSLVRKGDFTKNVFDKILKDMGVIQ